MTQDEIQKEWDSFIEYPNGSSKLYAALPKRRLLTEKEICDAWGYVTGYEIEHGDSTEGRTMHVSTDEVIEFARIVEGSIGAEQGVTHGAQPCHT